MGFKIFIIFVFLMSISFTVSGQTTKDFSKYIDNPRLNNSRNFNLSGISNNNFKKEFDQHSLLFNDSIKHTWDSSVTRSKTLSRKPELNIDRLPLEFLAGNGLGVASGLVGGLLGFAISGIESNGEGGMPFNTVIGIGLTIFHAAGSIAGVYLTGSNNENIEYNIGWTIIGGLVGTGAEILCFYFESKSDNKSNTPLFLLTTTLPTIGSMVGLHTTMEYKNPGSKINSLLNFESGKLNLKLPAINSKRLPCIWVTQNTSNLPPRFYYTVSLLSYNF